MKSPCAILRRRKEAQDAQNFFHDQTWQMLTIRPLKISKMLFLKKSLNHHIVTSGDTYY